MTKKYKFYCVRHVNADATFTQRYLVKASSKEEAEL